MLLLNYMDEISRDKYEILDLIFTFLNTLCMVLTAFFLLNNLIISLIYGIFIVIFAFVVLYLWIARNPLNIFLIRAFALNNFIFTFISLILFFSNFAHTLTEYPGFILFLFPSGIYLVISYNFTAVTLPYDKKTGAMLAYTGRTEASRLQFFRDNMEERKNREELVAKQKKGHRYKLIIVLTIFLTLISLLTLILGF